MILTPEQAIIAARRLVERRLETLRATTDAPNRGMWDYPSALRAAQKRLDDARKALEAVSP